jgi:hypothetical protein
VAGCPNRFDLPGSDFICNTALPDGGTAIDWTDVEGDPIGALRGGDAILQMKPRSADVK